MRLGVVSDIHGNAVALEAVREDMPDVDRLVCAGDVVGYNPWHADCVAWVRETAVPTVMGNHDRAVASDTAFAFNGMARAGVGHARDQLDDDQLAWLAGLPDERTLWDGRVVVVHGHPDDPDHYTYPDEFGPELLAAAGDPDLLIMGHTHIQHHETYAEGIVLNPGSVGQPRDRDPRAAYAVVDLDAGTVEERRVAYDIDAVIARVTSEGLPDRIGTRLRDGR
jgi:putative phosphoesterase